MAGKAVKRVKAARYAAPMPRNQSASLPPPNGRPGGGLPVAARKPSAAQAQLARQIERAIAKSSPGMARKRTA